MSARHGRRGAARPYGRRGSRRPVREGPERRHGRPHRRRRHRHLVHRPRLHADGGPRPDRVGGRLPGARDHPRRLHPDAAGRVRLPRAQPADARLRHLVHVGGARVRALGRLDGRLGTHRRHHPRAVESRRHRRRVPLPADRADRRQPGTIAELAFNPFINVAVCLLFMLGATLRSRTATCRPRRSCSTSW